MNYVASVTAYTASPETTLDAGSTLNILAGDVLVCYVAGNMVATLSISGIAEDDSSNAFTVLGNTGNWWWAGSGYLLSASASSGATIRVALSGSSNGEWGFVVIQFRPESGETVSFDSGPASASSSYGTNPTSGQLSTSESKSMWIGGASNDRAAMSNHSIGGIPDGTIQHGSIYLDVSYLEYSSAQSNLAYSTTSSSGVWGAQLICLEIATSGGTTYSGTISESAVATDTESSQAIFGGSISESDAISDSDGATGQFNHVISESMSITDLQAAQAVFIGSLSEGVSISDLFNRLNIMSGTISENTAVSDSFSSLAELLGNIAESSTATDQFSSLIEMFSSIAESASVTDLITAIGTYAVSIGESVSITDIISIVDDIIKTEMLFKVYKKIDVMEYQKKHRDLFAKIKKHTEIINKVEKDGSRWH